MSKGNRKIENFDVNSMREAVSNMMSDPDMVDDIRAMGNRVLGRLSKQIEDFKQIKAKILEDHAFGATYAISTCELLSNIKNKTWKTQADIKEKFFDKIKQCLKDFGGENIDEIKRAYSGAEQNLQIIKAVESLLENNIKKIVHDYNFMKGGIPEGVL